MPSGTSNPKADIVLSVVVILLSVVVYINAMGLPPAHWEPLGSAALPQALCVIMTVLASIVLLRGVLALRSYAPPTEKNEDFRRRPWTAVGMFLLCAAYVAVMDLGILGFVTATVAFLVLLGLLFTRAAKRQIPFIFGFALVIAAGNYLIFTQFLYIDLP